MLYVAALHLGIQIIEGNVITPLAQKRAIDMPPAVVIGSQFVLGAVFGILGVIVATPLVAVILVLVRAVYIEDVQQP